LKNQLPRIQFCSQHVRLLLFYKLETNYGDQEAYETQR